MQSRRYLCVRAASLRAHRSARCHNNTHAYFVSRWEKEAERDDYFRTAPTENSGPKFKFRLLHSLVKLITFQNFKPKRVNKSEMLQNFSQTQDTVFHSSACISSSEGFFKNRSAHFCGKSPSSGACSSQIAILFSLGLKFLMKWKPTYIYGDLNFSESKQVFANLFSWRKLEGSLIISWKFQGRTPQEIWITAIFPARSKVVSYDVLHHTLRLRSSSTAMRPCVYVTWQQASRDWVSQPRFLTDGQGLEGGGQGQEPRPRIFIRKKFEIPSTLEQQVLTWPQLSTFYSCFWHHFGRSVCFWWFD